MTKENKPEMRFSGFNEDWKQRKLSDLGKIMTGSTPSTSRSEYYSANGIPWVTPTDIEETTISNTQRKLSEEGAKIARIVPANTILCTCIASIGKNTLLTVKGSFNQQINSLTPNSDNDAYFLLTESEFWSNLMKRTAASGTMQIVNKKEFSSLITMMPSQSEQIKIGSFFKHLDNTIRLQQRKLEFLKNQKKAFLEKMFPKEGENVPEIRFSGFSDAWKQRKLGEVAEYKKGFAFKSEDYIDNGIKIIRVSDLGKDTIKETGEVCILPEKSKQYEPWILRENDLIVTTVGSKPPVWDSLVGKAIYVSQMFDGSLLNQNAIRVRVKPGNNQVFLRYIFTKDYVDYLQTIIRGNANQGSITVEDLFKYNFRICSLKEQEKIGSFFAQLDNTITLQQRKLEILKNIKKSFLQKMFV